MQVFAGDVVFEADNVSTLDWLSTLAVFAFIGKSLSFFDLPDTVVRVRSANCRDYLLPRTTSKVNAL